MGSWFLLQESQLFLGSQQELLECSMCGLENGATVRTPPRLQGPQRQQQGRPPEAPVLSLPHVVLHLA